MKKITLSQGFIALVDDVDFEFLNQWKWHVSKDRNTYYAVRNVRLNDGKRTRILMHRLLLDTPKGLVTDHIAVTDSITSVIIYVFVLINKIVKTENTVKESPVNTKALCLIAETSFGRLKYL